MPYPEHEPLVELLHGALQLAALLLPLLIVAHRLHRGPLPRGGSGYVVNEVDPSHWVESALPATDKRNILMSWASPPIKSVYKGIRHF